MTDKKDYFHKLIELMDVLRSPEGCPWDREQTRETLKPMLIEESYEVLEALDSQDPGELCEELGDLLFQVVFHCRIAKERGEFDADEVCRRVYEKMVRRHPHVFGDARYQDAQELLKHWEDIKAAEQAQAGRTKEKKSLLDGIPPDLPALYAGYQISAKASRVGFDWPNLQGIKDKVVEEFQELEAAVEEQDPERIREEVGDLLFAALNAARFLQIDPETALNRANTKFADRFRRLERHFAGQGRRLKDVSLEEMETSWQDLKKQESGVRSQESE
ncbi:MAG: nucleoside triphosphate pyrophosphohydrolase [Acidobacteria bacterium]|nr:MAG: nucleoside triphosphate pyrophosphohydrolase [Acidobacteriota bacterium]